MKAKKTEKLPEEMTYEELLEMRDQANHAIEQIQAGMKVVNDELMIRLANEGLSGKIIGNWGISKATRYSFETTLEEAKELGATKEAVDTTKLKKLLTAGVAIPGVKKSEYILVREVEKDKAP